MGDGTASAAGNAKRHLATSEKSNENKARVTFAQIGFVAKVPVQGRAQEN